MNIKQCVKHFAETMRKRWFNPVLFLINKKHTLRKSQPNFTYLFGLTFSSFSADIFKKNKFPNILFGISMKIWSLLLASEAFEITALMFNLFNIQFVYFLPG